MEAFENNNFDRDACLSSVNSCIEARVFFLTLPYIIPSTFP